jgi:DNA polymerase III delta prime subunit
MALDIHEDINKKLDKLMEANKIPNIIFHGPAGGGKRILVNAFVQRIYANSQEDLRDCVMDVNCAHGKGIKFVRDDIKFFAKTNMKGGSTFKTVLLTNADKLTSDAQSALRRCIELYTHTTRFFIIVEDKYKLLRPILSRFCEIYVPEPRLVENRVNLHQYVLDRCFPGERQHSKLVRSSLSKLINSADTSSHKGILETADKLYEKGFCALDLIQHIETMEMCPKKKYQYLLVFRRIKREFRNEKLLMTFMLNFLFLRSEYDLENVTFM